MYSVAVFHQFNYLRYSSLFNFIRTDIRLCAFLCIRPYKRQNVEGYAPLFLPRYPNRKKYSDNLCIDRQYHCNMACVRYHRLYCVLCVHVCGTAGYGADLLFIMLLCIVFDGYRLRKRCHHRRYLYDVGKQHEYSCYILRRGCYFGDLFRRSLLTDVVGRASHQRVNAY